MIAYDIAATAARFNTLDEALKRAEGVNVTLGLYQQHDLDGLRARRDRALKDLLHAIEVCNAAPYLEA